MTIPAIGPGPRDDAAGGDVEDEVEGDLVPELVGTTAVASPRTLFVCVRVTRGVVMRIMVVSFPLKVLTLVIVWAVRVVLNKVSMCTSSAM